MLRARSRKSGQHKRLFRLVQESPLRSVDPRVKLALSILVAVAVMLPLEKLIVFWLLFVIFMFAVSLAGEMLEQMRRVAWIVAALFLIDAIFVDLRFAILITFRFTLVVSAFVIFFATTRPEEFRLALEGLRVPYRYAFSLSLAFFSIAIVREEWQAICEAQRSRGLWNEQTGMGGLAARLRSLVALGVPSIVLTVKRAWTLTEAAYARGFDAPGRRPYRRLIMRPLDWGLLGASIAVCSLLFIWR
jgi:energy-coupling factor transport system permease protein